MHLLLTLMAVITTAFATDDTPQQHAYGVVRHEGSSVIALPLSAEHTAPLLKRSVYRSRHVDEYDQMQVRELATATVGPLVIGQVLRAATADDVTTRCTVSGFAAEVPSGGGAEPTELPPDAHRSATVLAELSCEGEVTPTWVVPAGAPTPIWPTSSPGDAAARALMDKALAGDATVRAALEEAHATAGDRPVTHHRELSRVTTATGPVIVEVGRLSTGHGFAGCGEDDLVVPYVAIVEDTAQADLVGWFPLGDDAHVRQLVDLDRDGRLEVVVGESFGTRSRIIGTEGTMASAERLWWSFCPC